MKRLIKYINSIYRPAFIVLCIGLAIFALSICILAVNMRLDMLSGESDILFKYPKLMNKVMFPLYILLFITLIIDLNERTKKSWQFSSAFFRLLKWRKLLHSATNVANGFHSSAHHSSSACRLGIGKHRTGNSQHNNTANSTKHKSHISFEHKIPPWNLFFIIFSKARFIIHLNRL